MMLRILLLFASFAAIEARKPRLELLLPDYYYEKFISDEFNYTLALNRTVKLSEKLVPFQDTTNDTFFRVGAISKVQLLNLTKDSTADLMGDIKNRPWMPLTMIRDELTVCAHSKYSALTDNDFKYDKGLYGWMNILKISCAEVGDGEFYFFAIAIARTRFRLRQVHLRRQNRYWATSGRSVITRDVQHIADVFIRQFAEYATEKVKEELDAIVDDSRRKKKGPKRPQFLRIPQDALRDVAKFFPENFKHCKSQLSRLHPFNTIGLTIKNRVILTRLPDVSTLVENYSGELTDRSCEILDTCQKLLCTYETPLNETYHHRTDVYNFSKERVLSRRLGGLDVLIMFQRSRPNFKFDSMKRKTDHGIVNVKQDMKEEARELWEQLVNQQFSLAIRTHNQILFPEVINGEADRTTTPFPSSLEVDLMES